MGVIRDSIHLHRQNFSGRGLRPGRKSRNESVASSLKVRLVESLKVPKFLVRFLNPFW